MSFWRRWRERGERARRLRRAEDLTLEGDLRGALAELDAAVRAFPEDVGAIRKAAETAAELGDAQGTAERLRRLIELDAREAAAVANALYDDLRSESAFQELHRFGADRLRGAELFLPAGVLYEAAGMRGEALACYEQAHSGGDFQGGYAAARLLALDGDADGSVEWVVKAAEAERFAGAVLEGFEGDSAFESVRETESGRAAQERLTEGRIASLRRAAESDEASLGGSIRLVAELAKRGRLEAAAEAAASASGRFPNNLELLELHAGALLQMRDFEGALERYGEVLRLRVDHAGALLGTGLAYEGLGRLDSAREAYWDALGACRGDVSAAWGCAVGFARAGDGSGAAEALHAAAEALRPGALLSGFLPIESAVGAFDGLKEDASVQSALERFRARAAEMGLKTV